MHFGFGGGPWDPFWGGLRMIFFEKTVKLFWG